MFIFKTSSLSRPAALARGLLSRRHADTNVTPGRCGNLDYCTIGMQRVLVQVPLDTAFVCPECASPLRPPAGHKLRGRRDWLPTVRLGVLLAAMAISLGLGYAIGRSQDKVGLAARSAARDAGASLAVASRSLGLTDPPANASPAEPPVLVAERPYPARLPSVDVSNPAERLSREARFGQVTVDCLLEAPDAKPACQVSDIRGADAFSAQAIAWLQRLNVRYAPSPHAGTTIALDHRWRVVLEDFSGTSR